MGFFDWFKSKSEKVVVSERTGASKILTIIAEGGIDKTSKRWDPLQTKIKYPESWDIMKEAAEKYCGIKGLYYEDHILRSDKYEDFTKETPVSPDINIDNIEGLSQDQLITLFPDLKEPFKKVSELVKKKAAEEKAAAEKDKDEKTDDEPKEVLDKIVSNDKVVDLIKGVLSAILKEETKEETPDKTAPVKIEAVKIGASPAEKAEKPKDQEPDKKEDKDNSSDKEKPGKSNDKNKTDSGSKTSAENKSDKTNKPDKGKTEDTTTNESEVKKETGETVDKAAGEKPKDKGSANNEASTEQPKGKQASENKGADKKAPEKETGKADDKGDTVKKAPEKEDKQELYVPKNFEFTSKALAGMPAAQYNVFNRCMKKFDRMKKFFEKYPNCLFRQTIVRIANGDKKYCVYLFKDATGIFVEVLYNTELEDSKPNIVITPYKSLDEVQAELKEREMKLAAETDEEKKKVLEKRVYHLDPKLLAGKVA